MMLDNLHTPVIVYDNILINRPVEYSRMAALRPPRVVSVLGFVSLISLRYSVLMVRKTTTTAKQELTTTIA